MPNKILKFSVISHFYIALIIDGLQRLSGLFMLELLQSMNVPRQSAALPFTLSWAVANMMSSLSDVFLPNKNSEYIKLLGVLLCAVGAALCLFSANIYTLILSWGFIFGAGYGLCFPYLSKHLKNTNSCKVATLLQATPSLGVAIMPFIFQLISSYYGLQGSCLIFSGIILNYVPLYIAAAYNIKLTIPSIKWKVRKRSCQYSVSKQTVNEMISNESFINSLEPDLILKISESEGCNIDVNCNGKMFNTCVKEVVHTGRKRTETRGNDLQSLPMDMRLLPRNKTHSETAIDIQNYEKSRNLFEASFCSKEVIYEDEENFQSKQLNFQDKAFNCAINSMANELENNTFIVEGQKINDEPTTLKMNDSNTESNAESNLSIPADLESNSSRDLTEKSRAHNCDQICITRNTSKSLLEEETDDTTEDTSINLRDKTLQKPTENTEATNFHSENTSTQNCHISVNNGERNEVSNENSLKTNITSPMHTKHMEKYSRYSVTESDINNESKIKCQQDNSFEHLKSSNLNRTDILDGISQKCVQINGLISRKEQRNGIQPEKIPQEDNPEKLPKFFQRVEKCDQPKIMDSKAKHPKLSSKLLENKTIVDIPLDIKVHVVECTYEGDEDNWFKNLKKEYLKPRNNTYRKHSNSMIQGTYDNIDFTTLNRPNNSEMDSEFSKPRLSRAPAVSENSDIHSLNWMKQEQSKMNYILSKIKQCFKFVNEMSMPVCLSIILITIIFELNLVTLITIFADFGNEVDTGCRDFKWILVAFGVGGLIGKFCCCKISRTIPEKSHAIGVVLFLLIGLSTAGILYSPNLNWLAGFYCMLGALEGGISFTIPKFVLEYIDRDLHSKLLMSKRFLSGVAILSIPYAIGLSRDQLGDYEFLLQTLSCSSVLCAFLVYFLPHLSRTSDKKKSRIQQK